MCLTITENSIAQKAETDIICYKVALKQNNRLCSYFRNSTINIGELYKSDLYKDKFFTDIIEIGLHSIIRLEDAVKFIKRSKNKIVILKCVIPKDSLFYEGIFSYHFGYLDSSGSCKSYASDKLIYVQEMINNKP